MIRSVYIIFIVFIGFLLACQRNSFNPQQNSQIDLSFKFNNEPFPVEQKPGSLSKQSQIVKAKVLSLNCDGASPDTANDASSYSNIAFLTNLTREESTTGKSLSFNGTSSYAHVSNSVELDGIYGFTISADIKFSGISSSFQTIIEKTGIAGGYLLGVRSGNLYLYVNEGVTSIELKGNVRINPDQWMNVKAGFDGENLFIIVNNEPDVSQTFSGTIPKNYSDLYIGAMRSATSMTDFFIGQMDNILLETRIDYIDLDVIRVSVIDVSVFDTADSLYTSNKYEGFYSERITFWKRNRQITWTGLTDLYQAFFPIISQQNLVIKDGFAEGVITGVEGLNMITVAAIKDEIVTYYGDGVIFIHRDKIEKVEITMYQAK